VIEPVKPNGMVDALCVLEGARLIITSRRICRQCIKDQAHTDMVDRCGPHVASTALTVASYSNIGATVDSVHSGRMTQRHVEQ
jgi:hypothetical protein